MDSITTAVVAWNDHQLLSKAYVNEVVLVSEMSYWT